MDATASDSGTPTGRPVALVTGASRGLGFLLAREWARAGHDLVVCARSADGLEPAAENLRGEGVEVEAVEADVADRDDVTRLVARTEHRFGRLDVLVANAGIIQVGPAGQMRAADHRHAMDVAHWGTVHAVLEALPLLQRSRGRVLAVTSLGGKLPAPHLLPYAAAKHAAVGFAEGLRVESGRLGIGVTVAVPGLMRTGSTRNALVTGDRVAERRWFTVAASLPVLSMDAERAARRLVAATRRGRAEVVLTPAAALAIRAHALAPNLTLRVTTAIADLLPTAPDPVEHGADPPLPGRVTDPQPGWFRRLTRLDRVAARRFHQHDDPAPVDDEAVPGGPS
ncbi:MAG: SDR family NAD(P)-dependent oxidoreductase [Actinomycetota bacterium]|nr:SDR family NAD(P)-dependent oxidoreductase [Actinomycetota bacterium]